MPSAGPGTRRGPAQRAGCIGYWGRAALSRGGGTARNPSLRTVGCRVGRTQNKVTHASNVEGSGGLLTPTRSAAERIARNKSCCGFRWSGGRHRPPPTHHLAIGGAGSAWPCCDVSACMLHKTEGEQQDICCARHLARGSHCDDCYSSLCGWPHQIALPQDHVSGRPFNGIQQFCRSLRADIASRATTDGTSSSASPRRRMPSCFSGATAVSGTTGRQKPRGRAKSDENLRHGKRFEQTPECLACEQSRGSNSGPRLEQVRKPRARRNIDAHAPPSPPSISASIRDGARRSKEFARHHSFVRF